MVTSSSSHLAVRALVSTVPPPPPRIVPPTERISLHRSHHLSFLFFRSVVSLEAALHYLFIIQVLIRMMTCSARRLSWSRSSLSIHYSSSDSHDGPVQLVEFLEAALHLLFLADDTLGTRGNILCRRYRVISSRCHHHRHPRFIISSRYHHHGPAAPATIA